MSLLDNGAQSDGETELPPLLTRSEALFDSSMRVSVTRHHGYTSCKPNRRLARLHADGIDDVVLVTLDRAGLRASYTLGSSGGQALIEGECALSARTHRSMPPYHELHNRSQVHTPNTPGAPAV